MAGAAVSRCGAGPEPAASALLRRRKDSCSRRRRKERREEPCTPAPGAAHGCSPTPRLTRCPRRTWREKRHRKHAAETVARGTAGSYWRRWTRRPLAWKFFVVFPVVGPPTAAAAAAALSTERCPGLPSPMQNLTAPGGPGNSNVTCSCNCSASQPQGMEICE